MEGQLAVPFHFAAEFLILAVTAGACLDSVRRARSGGSFKAGAQAFGFALLAVAQALHGARIAGAADDGALIAIGLRAAGFIFIALGARSIVDEHLGFAGFVPAALVAAGAGLFQPGPQAQLSLIAAVCAAAASVRGFAAHRRDQDPGSFAFTLAFGLFAAGEAILALTPPGGGSGLALSHGLRFLGALLLSRWLAAAIGRSVRLRFVSSFVIALTVLVLVLSASLNAVISGNLAREELRRIEEVAKARLSTFERRQDDDRQNALNLAQLLSADANPNDNVFVQLPDRTALAALSCIQPDKDVFMSVRSDGRVVAAVAARSRQQPCDTNNIADFLRRHPAPSVAQDIRLGIAGSRVVDETLRRGNVRSDFEQIAGLIGTVSAAPITSGGRRIGALVTARIFRDAALRAEKTDPANELTMIVGGKPIVTTLTTGLTSADDLVTGPLGERVRKAVEEDGETFTSPVTIDRAIWFAAYIPIRDVRNQTIGIFAVCVPQAGVVASQRELNRVLFVLALVAAVIAALIAWAAGGRVTRPIRALTSAAESVRRGDLTARAPADSSDELGTLGRSFNEMAMSLDRSTADLRAAAITESELRGEVEAIMQSMSDGLVATDTEGRIVRFNRAAEKLVGVDGAKMLGAPLSQVVRGSDAIGRSLAEAALSSPGATGSLGGKVPVAITSAPLRDAHGQEAGRVIVLRDISAEVQAERMKSEFLSNVSHELRTPLTPIKGYTEILKRKKFPKEKAESFLDGILESTTRLERIVEILVDFAAMEAGRLKPRTEAVEVKAFVDGLVDRWKERGTGKITVKIPATLPAVDADPRLLAKTLDELIDNAVKFSPKTPKVEIEARAEMNGSRSRAKLIKISVRDYGSGIAKDQLPDLFRDFQQLDGSETREHGGLGLGLAYAKRVASVHGGDVSAESVLGKGSVFTLTLPAASVAAKSCPPKKVKR